MRKVFVSYAHRLDQQAADDFRDIFSDDRNAFIDKSMRDDLSDYNSETIKSQLRSLIAQSTVTVILIGAQTGGRSWVDWEIYNSLRKSSGNERNGLLGIKIAYKEHWIPERLSHNIDQTNDMGLIIDWPSNYRTLENAIEQAYSKRFNAPYLSTPLRERNSTR